MKFNSHFVVVLTCVCSYVCNATVLIKFGRVIPLFKKIMNKDFTGFDPLENFGIQSRQLLCDAVINAKQFTNQYHESYYKHRPGGSLNRLAEWDDPEKITENTINYQRYAFTEDRESRLLMYRMRSVVVDNKFRRIKTVQCVNTMMVKWYLTFGRVNKFMFLLEVRKYKRNASLRVTGIFEPSAIIKNRNSKYFYDQIRSSKDMMESICNLGNSDTLRIRSVVFDALNTEGSLSRPLEDKNYLKKERRMCIERAVKASDDGEHIWAQVLRGSIFRGDKADDEFYVLGDSRERGAVFVFFADKKGVLELHARVTKVGALTSPAGPEEMKLQVREEKKSARKGKQVTSKREESGTSGVFRKRRRLIKKYTAIEERESADGLKNSDEEGRGVHLSSTLTPTEELGASSKRGGQVVEKMSAKGIEDREAELRTKRIFDRSNIHNKGVPSDSNELPGVEKEKKSSTKRKQLKGKSIVQEHGATRKRDSDSSPSKKEAKLRTPRGQKQGTKRSQKTGKGRTENRPIIDKVKASSIVQEYEVTRKSDSDYSPSEEEAEPTARPAQKQRTKSSKKMSEGRTENRPIIEKPDKGKATIGEDTSRKRTFHRSNTYKEVSSDSDESIAPEEVRKRSKKKKELKGKSIVQEHEVTRKSDSDYSPSEEEAEPTARPAQKQRTKSSKKMSQRRAENRPIIEKPDKGKASIAEDTSRKRTFHRPNIYKEASSDSDDSIRLKKRKDSKGKSIVPEHEVRRKSDSDYSPSKEEAKLRGHSGQKHGTESSRKTGEGRIEDTPTIGKDDKGKTLIGGDTSQLVRRRKKPEASSIDEEDQIKNPTDEESSQRSDTSANKRIIFGDLLPSYRRGRRSNRPKRSRIGCVQF